MKVLLLFAFAMTLISTKILAKSPEPARFAAFEAKTKTGEIVNVVFFGGSLTWGAQATDPQLTSYRALVSQQLIQNYPKARFRFWDAAIGGTGSQLGAFRLDRDVLAHQPDLVFLDFTVNDDAYMKKPDPDRLASYESLVRRMTAAAIPVVMVILPKKVDVSPNPPERPLDLEHKKIASAYGLPVADAVALVKQRVKENQATADQLWDAYPDVTHPGDAGYALYAEAVWDALQNAIRAQTICQIPPQMLHADTYMTVNRFRLDTIRSLPEGWKVALPQRVAITFDFLCSRWMEKLAVAENLEEKKPAPLRLNVTGSGLLLFGESTQKSGKYAVSIDGGAPVTYSAKCEAGNMRLVQQIAQGLDARQTHQIEIIPQLESGEELRIESLCISGSPAKVSF